MERSFSLGLVIAFPLLTSLVVLVAGRWLQRRLGPERGKVGVVYLSLFGSSMALFFLAQAVFGVLDGTRIPSLVDDFGPWLAGEQVTVQANLVLDPLAGVVCLGVAVASLLVQLFLVGWVGDQEDGHRMLAWVGGLEAALLLLVMAGSLGVVVAAWLAIGLLAHLAVGWRADATAADAARRHGQLDLLGGGALLLAALVLLAHVPSFDFETIRLGCAAGAGSSYRALGAFSVPGVEIAVGLIVLAGAVRCGQFPFHAAMEASAHAPLPLLGLWQGVGSTLAFVYVVIRLEAVFTLAPVAMAVMTSLGLLGAVAGALIALGEDRIDRILTYSTVSQGGLVFAALGMGAWSVALALALAHGAAKAGLASCCAAASVGDGSLDRTRVEQPAVVYAAFALSASLAGLIPGAGFFALHDATLRILVSDSAWSIGINYVGVAACVVCTVATTAYVFRLHYLVFRRPTVGAAVDGPGDGPADGMFAVAAGTFAVLALGLGLLGLPESTGLPRVLEEWIAPATRVGVGIGNGVGNEAFRLGASPGWTTSSGGLGRGVQWFVFLGLVVATVGAWRHARVRFVDGSSAPRGWSAVAVRFARRLAGVETALWRRSGELADALATFVVFGIDRTLLGRGADGVRHVALAVGGGLVRVGRGPPSRAAVGVLLGVVFVLGWVYFKPSIASLGPDAVHPFGGLKPALERPADSRSRRERSDEPPDGTMGETDDAETDTDASATEGVE